MHECGWKNRPCSASKLAYQALAARLEASLDRFGLDHRIVGIEPLGSWERNCAMKARFVRDQRRAPGRPVVGRLAAGFAADE